MVLGCSLFRRAGVDSLWRPRRRYTGERRLLACGKGICRLACLAPFQGAWPWHPASSAAAWHKQRHPSALYQQWHTAARQGLSSDLGQYVVATVVTGLQLQWKGASQGALATLMLLQLPPVPADLSWGHR